MVGLVGGGVGMPLMSGRPCRVSAPRYWSNDRFSIISTIRCSICRMLGSMPAPCRRRSTPRLYCERSVDRNAVRVGEEVVRVVLFLHLDQPRQVVAEVGDQ